MMIHTKNISPHFSKSETFESFNISKGFAIPLNNRSKKKTDANIFTHILSDVIVNNSNDRQLLNPTVNIPDIDLAFEQLRLCCLQNKNNKKKFPTRLQWLYAYRLFKNGATIVRTETLYFDQNDDKVMGSTFLNQKRKLKELPEQPGECEKSLKCQRCDVAMEGNEMKSNSKKIRALSFFDYFFIQFKEKLLKKYQIDIKMSKDKSDFLFAYKRKFEDLICVHVVYNHSTQRVLLYEKYVNEIIHMKIENKEDDQIRQKIIDEELNGERGMIKDVINNGIAISKNN